MLVAAVLVGSMAASNAFSQSSQANNPAVPATPARGGAPVHFVPRRWQEGNVLVSWQRIGWRGGSGHVASALARYGRNAG